jgi:hypothetical protein
MNDNFAARLARNNISKSSAAVYPKFPLVVGTANR